MFRTTVKIEGTSLKVDYRDVRRLVSALLDSNTKIAGIAFTPSTAWGSTRLQTLRGDGWTLHLTSIFMDRKLVACRDLSLYGDEERFLEDFIQAKLTIA